MKQTRASPVERRSQRGKPETGGRGDREELFALGLLALKAEGVQVHTSQSATVPRCSSTGRRPGRPPRRARLFPPVQWEVDPRARSGWGSRGRARGAVPDTPDAAPAERAPRRDDTRGSRCPRLCALAPLRRSVGGLSSSASPGARPSDTPAGARGHSKTCSTCCPQRLAAR